MAQQNKSTATKSRHGFSTIGHPRKTVIGCCLVAALGCLVISVHVLFADPNTFSSPTSQTIAAAATSPEEERTTLAHLVHPHNMTSSASAGRTAELEPGQAHVKFYSGAATDCFVGSFKFLDWGYDGHVYSATMACSGKKSNDVVVKAYTGPANASDEEGEGPIVYRSKIRRNYHKRLYRCMMGRRRHLSESDAAKLQEHFAFPRGTVQIPRPLLYGNMDAVNRELPSNAPFVNETRDTLKDTPITATVFPLVSGRPIGDSSSFRISTRRRIARHLVYIYSEMFDRGLMHCDISFYHLIYSSQKHRTTLIDFERYEIVKDRTDVRLAWQQFQLLCLLGNLCDGRKHRKSRFEVENRVCGHTWDLALSPEELSTKVLPSLEKCEFPGTVNWTYQFKVPHPKSLYSEIRQGYKALVSWSSG